MSSGDGRTREARPATGRSCHACLAMLSIPRLVAGIVAISIGSACG